MMRLERQFHDRKVVHFKLLNMQNKPINKPYKATHLIEYSTQSLYRLRLSERNNLGIDGFTCAALLITDLFRCFYL